MSYEQNILLAYSGLNLLLNMKDLDMDRLWDMYIYCKTNGSSQCFKLLSEEHMILSLHLFFL